MRSRKKVNPFFYTNSKWNCMLYVLHNSTYMYLKCLSFIYWTRGYNKTYAEKRKLLCSSWWMENKICILNAFTWSDQVKCKVSSKDAFVRALNRITTRNLKQGLCNQEPKSWFITTQIMNRKEDKAELLLSRKTKPFRPFRQTFLCIF